MVGVFVHEGWVIVQLTIGGGNRAADWGATPRGDATAAGYNVIEDPTTGVADGGLLEGTNAADAIFANGGNAAPSTPGRATT